MRLYKTQNIFFDQFWDRISVKSLDQVMALINDHVVKESCDKVSSHSIFHALSSERQSKGFSVINGVLVMHGKVKKLPSRHTVFLRLDSPIRVNCGGEYSVDLIACTLSPAKFGALNLRYLARFTRLFRDEKLIENLKAVDSTDGMHLLLNVTNDVAA